jgi:putative ABC transport system ATP-binding protein
MISFRNLTKSYVTAAGEFCALRNVTLNIGSGEYIAVVGKSGSGKSTLLNMLGGIDRPSSGVVQVGDKVIIDLNEDQLARWRGKTIGFVFQFFQLLPTLTAAENVMLAMDFSGVIAANERSARARDLLRRVGVSPHADKLPTALSGGEQQRVAIARAMANDPPVILADEPTGNLDSYTTDAILHLLGELAGEGKTVVIVTHERLLPASINRKVELVDGVLKP